MTVSGEALITPPDFCTDLGISISHFTAAMELEEFAVAFTIAVTEVSDPTVDLVAKNGKHSIYSVFQEIFPQARAIMFCTTTLQQCLIKA